jgi:hypothetical protein
LFENEKQIQLFQMFLKKNPYSSMNNEKRVFTYETHVNEDTSNTIKYIQHDCIDAIQKFVLNHDQ